MSPTHPRRVRDRADSLNVVTSTANAEDSETHPLGVRVVRGPVVPRGRERLSAALRVERAKWMGGEGVGVCCHRNSAEIIAEQIN